MSIKKKLFVFYGLLMVGFIFILVVVDIFFASRFFIYESKKQMGEICSSLKEEFPQFEKSDLSDFDDYLENLDERRNVRIYVVNSSDELLFRNHLIESDNDRNKLPKRWSEFFHSHIDKLNDNKQHYEVFRNRDDALRRVVLMSKLNDNYYLIISRSLRSIQDNVRISNKLIIIIGLTVFIIGTILVFFLARRMSSSVIQINSAARSIANLDFTQKVKVKEKGEIGELADSINIISDKLNESINSLKESVVSREQLIRDMSHELKTPIAAVKGYAEGLKYGIAGDKQKAEKYCDVIVSQCDEMDSLVKSMLNLSKMNSMNDDVEKNTFLISELNDFISASFEIKLLNKNLSLVTNDFKNKQICANLLLLQQAVSNYVDNAIRYSPKGGTIEINYLWEDNGIKITVFNTGDRIDEVELEHLWDAFYKVDKSRTQNGTENYGVGLAIVKKIANIHKGNVWVENRDNGVLFGIFIPQQ